MNTTLFSKLAIPTYTAQVKNMSLIEAEAVLMKAGLNQATREQILTNAGLISSEQGITAAQQQQLITSGLVTSEQMSQIAATLGLETAESGALIAKEALNAEQVKQQLTSIGVVGASQQQILSMLGLATAEGTATVATTGLARSLNSLKLAFLSNPITFIATILATVGATIYSFVSGMETAEEKLQKVKEAAETARVEIEQLNSELKSKTSTIEEVKDRYAELAQEVEDLGKSNQSQGTLSTAEYEEFLDLSNKLSELFPTLNKGFDDNGNAILKLTGNVNTIVSSLKNLVSVQEKLARQEIIGKMPEMWTDYTTDLYTYDARIKTNEASIKNKSDLDKTIQFSRENERLLFFDSNNTDENNNYNYIRDKLEGMGFTDEDISKLIVTENGFEKQDDGRSYKVKLVDGNNNDAGSRIISNADADKMLTATYRTLDLSKLSESDYIKLLESLNSDINKAQNEIDLNQSKKKSANSEMSSYLSAWLSEEWSFIQMKDPVMKQFASDILLNTNWVDLLPDNINKGNWDEVSEWIQNNLLYSISKIDNEKIKTNLTKAYNGVLTAEEILNLKDNMIKNSEFDSNSPVVKYLDNLYEETKKYETYFNDTLSKFGTSEEQELKNFFLKQGIDSTEELDYFNEVTDGATTAAEAIAKYKKALNEKKVNDLKGITGTIKHLDEAVKPVMDSLQSAYQDIFTEDGFTLDNVGTDMLNSVMEAIAEINQIGGVDIETSAFEDFAKVLSTTEITMDGVKNKEEEVHKAFDNLVNKIIEGTDVTLVNSEAFDTLVQSLKNMGITNASEVLNEIKTTHEQLIKQGIDINNITAEEAEAFLDEAEALGISTEWFKIYTLQKAIAENPLSTTKDIEALENLCNVLGVSGEMLNYINTLKTYSYQLDIKQKYGAGAPLEYLQGKVDEAKANIQELIDKGGAFEFDLFNLKYDGNKVGDAERSSKEKFNWIETLISRIERNIANFGKTISATYKTWSERNSAIKGEYEELNDELQAQIKAQKYYENKASQVKLSEDYKEKVRDGKIEIESISNEETKKAIQEYQELWEAALEAKDAQEDIRASMVENFQTAFDTIQGEYDAKIGAIEGKTGLLDALISQQEAKGHIVSKKYYQEMERLAKENITLLENEYDSLTKSFNEAMASGKIAEGSEDWYNMKAEILGVEEALIGANTELVECAKNMRNLEWETFDKQQEAISRVTDEAGFLIDLMSDEDLFNEDTGELTEYGTATMGLHAVNYNTHMKEAQNAAEQLAKIDEKIAKGEYDPLDDEVIQKRREYIDLQQDSILAAKDEMQTLKDLKTEYYDNLLEALQELIDKRKEALQAEKDMYDYERTIAEKTKNIANLQKQIVAYSSSDAEEDKVKLQKLQVELQEAQEDLESTEWDRYLQDQNDMLDKLYEDAQNWVDDRLKHLETVIADIVGITNENSGAIRETLYKIASEYGYDMTDEMEAIWNEEDGDIASAFDKDFVSTEANILKVLEDIALDVKKMEEESDKEAKDNIKKSDALSETNKSQLAGVPAVLAGINTIKNNNSNNSSKDNSKDEAYDNIFIDKKNTYKGKLNKTGSIVDALRYFDYNESFDARKKYYNALIGSGTYTGNAEQNAALLKKFREIKGYHEGGVIGSLKNVIGRNGDNSLAINTFEKGEGIIPLSLMGDWKALIANLEPLNTSMDFINKALIPNIKANSGNIGNVNNDVTLNVTLPNVTNYAEFRSELIKDKTFEKAIISMNASHMTGKNSLSKFRH